MSYDTWLEGTLAIDPFPEADVAANLREALSAPRDLAAGKITLTPLGRGVVLESALDWEAALEALGVVREGLFLPAGLSLMGTLKAMGEDGAHLATVFVTSDGVRVEHHESEEGEDGDEDEEEDEEDD